jgi:hypothetical protein
MLASGGRPVALARPGGSLGRAAGKAPVPAVPLPTPRPLAPPRAIAPPSTEYDESPVKMQIGDGVAIGEWRARERRGLPGCAGARRAGGPSGKEKNARPPARPRAGPGVSVFLFFCRGKKGSAACPTGRARAPPASACGLDRSEHALAAHAGQGAVPWLASRRGAHPLAAAGAAAYGCDGRPGRPRLHSHTHPVPPLGRGGNAPPGLVACRPGLRAGGAGPPRTRPGRGGAARSLLSPCARPAPAPSARPAHARGGLPHGPRPLSSPTRPARRAATLAGQPYPPRTGPAPAPPHPHCTL